MKKNSLAPDFTLLDQNNNQFTLSDFKGSKILLSFHPLAWTSICAEQMISLENSYSEFETLNTIATGISIDSVPCKEAWANHLKLEKTRILSDFWPHGAIAKSFGLFRESDGFSERANIVVDENGKIAFIKIYEISQLPDIIEIITSLKQMD